MYSQSSGTSTGTRPSTGGVGRKWAPVATGTASGGRPPPMAPKPSSLTHHAVNGGHTPTGPKPFQNDNMPAWKRELENRKMSAENKDTTLPPWKQRQQQKAEETRRPSWGQHLDEPAAEKHENLPPWKQRQQEKAEETRHPSWGQHRDEPAEEKHETLPPWKQRQQQKAEENRRSWGQKQEDAKENDANIPAWKRELNRAKHEAESVPAWKAKSNEDTKPTPPWGKPKTDDHNTATSGPPRWGAKPSPKPDVGAKPSTVPWSERNKQSTPPVPDAPKPNPSDHLAPRRSNHQNKSFTGYNTMPKPTIEKSSGSFGSATQKSNDDTANLNTNVSPQKRVSSFLHTKPTGPKPPIGKPHVTNDTPPPPPMNAKPQKQNGVPRRLPIPEDKHYEPPPLKPSKPPNVVLPTKGKKKLSLPSLPTSLFSRGSSTPTSRDLPAPPPPTGARDLPLPPPLGARDFPVPPPMGARNPSPNLPPLPSRPDIGQPPALPGRPLPSPIPGKMSMPLPVPPVEDDIYDDPGEEPPPPPRPMAVPPLLKRKSSGMIETWDDEEDNIYDETPDEPPPPPRPQIPAGFPMPGGAVPQIPEDDEEMYEDVEEYMRLKKLQQQGDQATNGSAPDGKKDKKKNNSEKKEKDIRKKFKLPADGDIYPEGHGIVKESVRGGWGKGLGVSANERIEIIRMADNPKGKWLIRNEQGEYGYVDSDKITIDVSMLRNTFGVGTKAPSGIGGGPPVPPPIIPTSAEDEEDDVIYDQTADEDIYEEV